MSDDVGSAFHSLQRCETNHPNGQPVVTHSKSKSTILVWVDLRVRKPREVRFPKANMSQWFALQF